MGHKWHEKIEARMVVNLCSKKILKAEMYVLGRYFTFLEAYLPESCILGQASFQRMARASRSETCHF